MAFFGQGEEFEPSLFVEVDESFLLHFLENFDNVRIRAVDSFGEAACVHLTFCVSKFDQHHGWLFSEECFEYLFVLQVVHPGLIVVIEYIFKGFEVVLERLRSPAKHCLALVSKL